ncbi:ABC transporter ATP-binding protein [Ancylobacter sp. 6x-1]|uniref:ABC transporter ATP-binding protein n=1 Tax=Ancylobacter crimeensis TaxID=2579147 RepID=A0ABT0DAG4_9HYPH|nr:ABC transporter ATP-binding protein [Ancylobacter crimeensis]MCK0196949.1 ABC transporter ATP-binding protein [Ancylobacter crimeensis]
MLSLRHVGKTYPNGAEALAGVTLEVAPGEILAIVGGSGCGKSTLLRLVAGLEGASAGRIALDGVPLAGPHPAIGIVFQEPRLLPWLTVAGNIGFGLTHLSRPAREARIAAALARIGLPDYGGRWPRELSGGQAQRVALARALVVEPRVLLLDEPFSALDAFIREDLQGHLLALWSDTRPTLVLVTHDIEEALVLADRVVVMQPKPGRITQVLTIDLPRPRARTGADLLHLKQQVLGLLRHARPAAAKANAYAASPAA